jgi:hypothetical protein
MREEQFREWLEKNHPNSRTGDWAPFETEYGSCLEPPALQGSQFELRLFHNGALSFTFDRLRMETQKRFLNLAHAGKIIKDYALSYLSNTAELLQIASPLIIKVENGVCGLKAIDPSEAKFSDPLTAGVPLSRNLIVFQRRIID